MVESEDIMDDKNSPPGSYDRSPVRSLPGASLLARSSGERVAPAWANSIDLLCFSHLRWDFVFQRPQHLMTRFAAPRRVFFFEEPILQPAATARLEIIPKGKKLWVVRPHLASGLQAAQQHALLQGLLDTFLVEQALRDYVAWYYTPMALGFTRRLQPRAVVYDCMDELSAFRGAPASLIDHEAELFHRADLVFTGGQSLYEAKRELHSRVYAVPSSIDRAHFAKARKSQTAPADQSNIPGPRIGFAGVIDERMDIDLLRSLAELRPDWHFIMIGPVVKINQADLPNNSNIHYLGQKDYQELPAYMGGWDAAILPFARNESTRFISPTKTPEYLAAGCAVVGTSIRDVVRPYGEKGFVRIADDPAEFAAALEASMANNQENQRRRREVDDFLNNLSWDATWARMQGLINAAILDRLNRRLPAQAKSSDTDGRRRAASLGGPIRRSQERRVRSTSTSMETL